MKTLGAMKAFRTGLSLLILMQGLHSRLAYNVAGLQRSQNLLMSRGTSPRSSNFRRKSVVKPMTRKRVLEKLTNGAFILPGAVVGLLGAPGDARAKDTAPEAPKVWISGKGAQPKGSDDKTGTRKETKYLRCLSNCLADCQKPTDGPEKGREECLQLCQDECCMSYEQCTYVVTQNK